ncbi:MAG: hypothetical protein CMM44_02830 [Rhodospirillaceae bacterium]|nr:hypothetical protein [Rhodospirillaceae bacterium]
MEAEKVEWLTYESGILNLKYQKLNWPWIYERAYKKKKNFLFKTCNVCKRNFVWRRKWADNWEQVKYCSKRCQTFSKRGKQNIR